MTKERATTAQLRDRARAAVLNGDACAKDAAAYLKERYETLRHEAWFPTFVTYFLMKYEHRYDHEEQVA